MGWTRKWQVGLNTWMTRWQSPHHQWAGSCRKALRWRTALLWAPPVWTALETWTSSFWSKKTLFPSMNESTKTACWPLKRGLKVLLWFKVRHFSRTVWTWNRKKHTCCSPTWWTPFIWKCVCRFLQRWQLCKSCAVYMYKTRAPAHCYTFLKVLHTSCKNP